MKVKIKKDLRLWHKEGETVEVSPEAAELLVNADAAEIVKENKKK